MKQLGLALHGYHAAHECFPPAGIGYGWCLQGASYGLPQYVGDQNVLNASGLMMLLPYLEQTPLYDAYNQKQCASNYTTGAVGALCGDAVSSGNAQVAATPLAVFSCPSDTGERYLPADDPQYGIQPGSGYQGVKTNYDFNVCGTGELWCNVWPSIPDSSRPMFGQNSNCNVAQVRDGTSNTVALAETTCDCWCGGGTAWGYRGWAMAGVAVATGINVWTFASYGPPDPYPGRVGQWTDVGSQHPGGAHAVMADGSVHFLSETTDLVILAKLSAMADGEMVTLP